MAPNDDIAALVARGALFVVNHSGGKDSQAMFHHVLRRVPRAQIVVIHAHLAGVEWDGTWEHVLATTLGVPCTEVRAKRELLQMIAERGMFPSPTLRQCTSDLKRDPIDKEIRRIARERGVSLIVSCMGLRAEESSARAKRQTLKLNARNSKAGREWYDWLPIHAWSAAQVFETIAGAGQQPHWAYAAGMSRLSCCFCIMASKSDLTTAARLNPELYARYVALERSTGQTMLMPKNGVRVTLEEITGVKALPVPQPSPKLA